jgi:hypothetical protein
LNKECGTGVIADAATDFSVVREGAEVETLGYRVAEGEVCVRRDWEVVRNGEADDPGVIVPIDRGARAVIAGSPIPAAAQVRGIEEGLAVGADLGYKCRRRSALALAAFGDTGGGAKLRIAQRAGCLDDTRRCRIVNLIASVAPVT